MWLSLLGGGLIGLGAVVLMLGNGRIAGISGIVYGLFSVEPGERLWRALFLLGLPLGAGLYLYVFGGQRFEPSDVGLGTLLLGGFLVGYGTRWANGCTSGHGVCGLARLSWRSFVAVGVFLSGAMLTVYLLRHVLA
jgi:uncharacterized membrane protein YedE/YeeE